MKATAKPTQEAIQSLRLRLLKDNLFTHAAALKVDTAHFHIHLSLSVGTMLIFHLLAMPLGGTPVQSQSSFFSV